MERPVGEFPQSTVKSTNPPFVHPAEDDINHRYAIEMPSWREFSSRSRSVRGRQPDRAATPRSPGSLCRSCRKHGEPLSDRGRQAPSRCAEETSVSARIRYIAIWRGMTIAVALALERIEVDAVVLGHGVDDALGSHHAPLRVVEDVGQNGMGRLDAYRHPTHVRVGHDPIERPPARGYC